ncbi:protein tyrosine kinase [Nocardia sp. KC 131]|uniref:protein tyrosine kinase n=1 Tax=Nocardia arseniciresistens TaxID=3392119 RepID=UPI00398ED582
MGLIDYWHIARRRWLIIAGVLLVCVLAAAGYAQSLPTTYAASSSMYVSMATGTSVNDSYQGGLAAQQRVRSYVDLAASATLAKRTIDDLGLKMSIGDVQGKITATSPPATTMIIITVNDSNPVRARDIANTVVAQFRRLIGELETIEVGAAPAARVEVIDRAEVPTEPTGPQNTRLLALGVLAGLGLGCLAAYTRDRTDRRLRTSNDLEAVLPVPILAIIDSGRPGADDETRRLRTRLLRKGEAATIMLTSLSAKSESEVTMALAKAFADTGRHVVLIDADTSHAGRSQPYNSEQSPGLARVLRGSAQVSEALTWWQQTGVTVLPLGDADPQTSDLLASDRFSAVIAKLRTDFDHVIVQAAPITHAADAIAIAPLFEQTLAVAQLGTTSSAQVRGALATYGDAPLTGVVAHSVPSSWLQRLMGRP